MLIQANRMLDKVVNLPTDQLARVLVGDFLFSVNTACCFCLLVFFLNQVIVDHMRANYRDQHGSVITHI